LSYARRRPSHIAATSRLRQLCSGLTDRQFPKSFWDWTTEMQIHFYRCACDAEYGHGLE